MALLNDPDQTIGNQLSASTRTSEIPARHDELNYQISELVELIEKLYGQFSPVLRNEPGEDIKVAEDNSTTDIGQFLGIQVNRLIRGNAAIRDILNRSEL